MLFDVIDGQPIFAHITNLPSKGMLATTRAILVVSPLSPQFHGKCLEAIIRKLEEKQFERVYFVITDAIKSSMLKMNAANLDKEERILLEEATTYGDNWLNHPQNQRAVAYIRAKPDRYPIVRWSEINYTVSLPNKTHPINLLTLLQEEYNMSGSVNLFHDQVALQSSETIDRFRRNGNIIITVPQEAAVRHETQYILTEYAGLLSLSIVYGVSYLLYPDRQEPRVLPQIRARFLDASQQQLMQWAGYDLKEQPYAAANKPPKGSSPPSSGRSSPMLQRRNSQLSDNQSLLSTSPSAYNNTPLSSNFSASTASHLSAHALPPTRSPEMSSSNLEQSGTLPSELKDELPKVLLHLTRTSFKDNAEALTVLQILYAYVSWYQLVLINVYIKNKLENSESFDNVFWKTVIQILGVISEKTPEANDLAREWREAISRIAHDHTSDAGTKLVLLLSANQHDDAKALTPDKIQDEAIKNAVHHAKKTIARLEDAEFDSKMTLPLEQAFVINLGTYATRLNDRPLKHTPKK